METAFDGGYRIMSVLPQSPAIEAGIRPGDILVAVDGVPVSQFDTPLSQAEGEHPARLCPKSGRAPLSHPLRGRTPHRGEQARQAAQRGQRKEKTRTAYHMVTDYVKARRVDDRIFVIHRLDRDTSGVLMFARDAETKELFQAHWNDMVTRRGYLAVVEGVPKPDRDTIRSWLVETDTHLSFSGAPGKGAKRGHHQL